MTKYIAIEGSDKVGKATQTKLLLDALNRGHTEYPAIGFSIPFNDSATYSVIYAMLKDGRAKETPGTFQALHVANRAVWQARHPNPHAEWIIFDRWNASTMVYGRVAGLSDAFITSLLGGVRNVDLTIVLDGPSLAPPEDTYEADTKFMRRVRDEYLQWAEGRYKVVVIDANRPRPMVHDDIMSAVTARFGGAS